MSNNNKVTPIIGSLHYIWHFEMLTTKMCCFIVVVVLLFHCGYVVVVVLLFCCGLSLFFDLCYFCVVVISSLFFNLFWFLCDPFSCVVWLLFVWLCSCYLCGCVGFCCVVVLLLLVLCCCLLLWFRCCLCNFIYERLGGKQFIGVRSANFVLELKLLPVTMDCMRNRRCLWRSDSGYGRSLCLGA